MTVAEMADADKTLALIRVALAKAAPKASPAELDCWAVRIRDYANVQLAARLASTARGTGPALIHLKTMNKQIGSLMKSVATMKADERLILRAQSAGLTPGVILRKLERLNSDVVAAHSQLRQSPKKPTRSGRPNKDAEQKLASYCRRALEALTGHKPTVVTKTADGKASGPFYCLVRDVFLALHLDASPEAQARKAVKISRSGD